MEKMAEVLEKLADTLGMTMRELWPYFVHQRIVTGWVTVIFTTGALSVLAWTCRKCLLNAQAWKQKRDEDYAVLYVPAAMAGLAMLFALGFLADGIRTLCAPEAAAVAHILSLFQ